MEFDNIIKKIADNLKRTLEFIPDEIKNKCEEIRIRSGLPLCLTVDGRVLFVCKNSVVCDTFCESVLMVTHTDLQQTLSTLCRQSVYMHENEIKQGFISLDNGCRAGVCGVFNSDGMLVSVTSINIRIARQIFNCAKHLLPYVSRGLLIAGPPGCGKTTILRDLIRLLSNGENGRYCRVAVIDSRNEISGGGSLDLGVNTDLLFTLNKRAGVDIALRTMFPDYIAFDEIGTTEELEGVRDCFNAGVGIITTAHCNEKEDILRRDIIREMVNIGSISNLVLLAKQSRQTQIFSLQELEKYAFA